MESLSRGQRDTLWQPINSRTQRQRLSARDIGGNPPTSCGVRNLRDMRNRSHAPFSFFSLLMAANLWGNSHLQESVCGVVPPAAAAVMIVAICEGRCGLGVHPILLTVLFQPERHAFLWLELRAPSSVLWLRDMTSVRVDCVLLDPPPAAPLMMQRCSRPHENRPLSSSRLSHFH